MATSKWARGKPYGKAITCKVGLLRVLRSRGGCILPGEAGAGLEPQEEGSVDGRGWKPLTSVGGVSK